MRSILYGKTRMEQQHDWERAAEIYASVWKETPDDLDIGLHLAEVLKQSGRGDEALDTLATLRRLPGAHGRDPRIDLKESSLLERMGSYERSLEVAVRAAAAAEERRARFGNGPHYRP